MASESTEAAVHCSRDRTQLYCSDLSIMIKDQRTRAFNDSSHDLQTAILLYLAAVEVSRAKCFQGNHCLGASSGPNLNLLAHC